MFFLLFFYCQDSIKFSLKSSAILHFRKSKLKISPIKPRTCSARLGLPNFNFSPLNQKELPTALIPYPHTHVHSWRILAFDTFAAGNLKFLDGKVSVCYGCRQT